MIQSVQRAMHILDLLAAAAANGQPMALSEVAGVVGLAPNTTHNLLKTLVASGYAAQDADRRYRLGPRAGEMARGAALLGPTRMAVESAVRDLVARTGEGAVLAVLMGGHRRVAFRLAGSQAVRVDTSFEKREMFYEVVTGRVLAAWASPEQFEEILSAQGMPGAKWSGMRSRRALEAALADVRGAGCAVARGKSDVTSMAAPLLDRTGALLGALGLYMPSFRADSAYFETMRRELVLAADRIAPLLGQDAPTPRGR